MRFFLSVSAFLISINSFALDCSTVGIASCTNSEGMCFEYPDFSIMPEAQIKAICKNMGGEFKNSNCDSSFNKGTCINESNPIMSIIRYNDSLDSDSAKMFCEMAGGTLCE